MAKKAVASLHEGSTDGRAYSKVIKMVKSPKTGAYVFDEKGEEVISERHQKDFKRELYAERLEGVRTNGAANGVTNGAYRNLDFEDL